MTVEPAIEDQIWTQLREFSRFGDGPNLARARRILGTALKGLPPGVVVTGSNGKGTVTHLLSGLLQKMGYRVGRFVSPHLVSITERISINDVPISHQRLLDALRTVARETAHDDLASASRFEVLTGAAVRVFAGEALDVIVWEAGLGGRLDPTRLVPKSLAVLTSLALEHTSVLGETLDAIADEKAAIAKYYPDDGTMERRQVPLLIGTIGAAQRQHLQRRYHTISLEEWEAQGHTEPQITLHGNHQRHNARLATFAASIWTGQTLLPTDLRDISVPCRTECIRLRTDCSPEVWVDLAHHESALIALRPWLDGLQRPLCLVFGVSADRPPEPMLAALPTDASVVFTEAPHKATPVETLMALHPGAAEPSIASAIRRAEHDAGAHGSVVILGGLYLAASAKACLQGHNPSTLRWS